MVKNFISMGAVVALMLAVALMPMTASVMAAEEQSATASVTVNESISITLADTSPAGIQFGAVAPATTDNPDTVQNATIPSVNITVESETNVNVNLSINGTDFSGAGTIAIGNASWHTSDANASSTALTTAYANVATNQALGSSTELWHWLSIPGGQTAGGYTSTFKYKAAKYT